MAEQTTIILLSLINRTATRIKSLLKAFFRGRNVADPNPVKGIFISYELRNIMLLREYQKATVSKTRSGFVEHKRQLMVLPTGGGKTIVFSEIVAAAANKGTLVLILTDRVELHNQTIESIRPYNIRYSLIDRNNKRVDRKATVFIAMVETFKRRMIDLQDIKFGLIIADEAHVANFNAVFDCFDNCRVIGATATPQGKHIYKYYTNIIQEIDTPELVDLGFLVDCKAYQMQDDFSDLETKAGEYTDVSLMNHFDKPKLYTGVVDEWVKHANNTKTIVFNINIEHTIKTYEAFKAAGISSEYITSKTPKEERNRILDAYSKNYFFVLLNCGILTKGYNEPSIQTVILNRATKSLPLFLQMSGRGSRIYPGKTHFTLLDFGMNHDRHGMWNEPREWKLKKPKEKAKQVAPVKTCPNDDCGCLVFASARICRYCGYVFPFVPTEAVEGVMVAVIPKVPDNLIGLHISDLGIDELYELEKSKRYKASFIWRVIRSHGEEAVTTYAGMKGYSRGWVHRQTQDIDNCEYTNYKIN